MIETYDTIKMVLHFDGLFSYKSPFRIISQPRDGSFRLVSWQKKSIRTLAVWARKCRDCNIWPSVFVPGLIKFIIWESQNISFQLSISYSKRIIMIWILVNTVTMCRLWCLDILEVNDDYSTKWWEIQHIISWFQKLSLVYCWRYFKNFCSFNRYNWSFRFVWHPYDDLHL